MLGGKKGGFLERAEVLAGERFDAAQPLDPVAEGLDAQGGLFIGGIHVDDVALDPEIPALEADVVARVLHVVQLAQEPVAVEFGVDRDAYARGGVGVGRADIVNARNAGDDDHVPARHERTGGLEPKAVDFVVDVGSFLNVRIGRRDIRLRLVIVVKTDEILDGVVRKVALEFLEKLRGEGLVV